MQLTQIDGGFLPLHNVARVRFGPQYRSIVPIKKGKGCGAATSSVKMNLFLSSAAQAFWYGM
jgi:hypothetical protein